MVWTDIILALARKGFDDPVYKKNLQRLIEWNGQFEDAKE